MQLSQSTHAFSHASSLCLRSSVNSVFPKQRNSNKHQGTPKNYTHYPPRQRCAHLLPYDNLTSWESIVPSSYQLVPVPNSAPDIDTENFWAKAAILKLKVRNQIANQWNKINQLWVTLGVNGAAYSPVHALQGAGVGRFERASAAAKLVLALLHSNEAGLEGRYFLR